MNRLHREKEELTEVKKTTVMLEKYGLKHQIWFSLFSCSKKNEKKTILTKDCASTFY